jgi:hypothetical protein
VFELRVLINEAYGYIPLQVAAGMRYTHFGLAFGPSASTRDVVALGVFYRGTFGPVIYCPFPLKQL